MKRKETLEKAIACVCGQREQDYGSPEDNFRIIAQLWTAYTGYPFDSKDVAMMMALLKIARIASGTATEDSFVDLAGYAACGAEIATKEKNSFKEASADFAKSGSSIMEAAASARNFFDGKEILEYVKE